MRGAAPLWKAGNSTAVWGHVEHEDGHNHHFRVIIIIATEWCPPQTPEIALRGFFVPHPRPLS